MEPRNGVAQSTDRIPSALRSFALISHHGQELASILSPIPTKKAIFGLRLCAMRVNLNGSAPGVINRRVYAQLVTTKFLGQPIR
jgi:hypothetical protein